MKTIAFCNRKGGTGKTSFCVNIAACLDRVYGKRVLVVDCDTQGNATSYLMGDQDKIPKTTLYTYFKTPEKTISHLQTNKLINQLTVVLGEKKKITINTNVDYIAAAPELDYLNIKETNVLKRLLDHVASRYDYCLLDCPPGVNEVSVNGLCAADSIVVPVVPGKDSINGYRMVADIVDGLRENGANDGLRILGVIINDVDSRTGHDRYYQSIWKEAGAKAFSQCIHHASVIRDAREFGKPLHYFQRTSNAAKEYQLLTKEIMDRLEES